MIKIGVAKLKAELSAHLREVRQGHEIVVFDRDTPVARIVPYEVAQTSGALVIRPARRGVRMQDVPLPPPLPSGERIVQMLIDERQQDRDRLR